jgi:hypothetical protein
MESMRRNEGQWLTLLRTEEKDSRGLRGKKTKKRRRRVEARGCVLNSEETEPRRNVVASVQNPKIMDPGLQLFICFDGPTMRV